VCHHQNPCHGMESEGSELLNSELGTVSTTHNTDTLTDVGESKKVTVLR
jgi:hypothetical protein